MKQPEAILEIKWQCILCSSVRFGAKETPYSGISLAFSPKTADINDIRTIFNRWRFPAACKALPR